LPTSLTGPLPEVIIRFAIAFCNPRKKRKEKKIAYMFGLIKFIVGNTQEKLGE
jgi:hypothetical protein